MNFLSRIFLGAFALFILTPLLNIVNLPHFIAGKVSSTIANAEGGQNCTGGDCFKK